MKKIYSATASGRVNLIGEHTDYNGGWVLPTAIPQQTRVSLIPRNDLKVRVESLNFSKEQSQFEYHLGNENRRGEWTDYIQGVTQVLLKDRFSIRGFEFQIESNVPMGSGLSSSAALEVSLLKALREAFDLPLNDVQIAQIGQRAENEFVGARVGIMDQMAASLASLGEALLIDTQDLSFRKIPLPLDQMDILVINSGVVHSNALCGGYNERRQECENICKILKITQLRDLDLPKLNNYKEILSLPLYKRARHVIHENLRVLEAIKAITQKDMKTLGKIFYASHESMKNDFEISVPEIDLLVDLARSESEVLGARLTGGGFGGSVVILTLPHRGSQIGKKLVEKYQKLSRCFGQVLVPSSNTA